MSIVELRDGTLSIQGRSCTLCGTVRVQERNVIEFAMPSNIKLLQLGIQRADRKLLFLDAIEKSAIKSERTTVYVQEPSMYLRDIPKPAFCLATLVMVVEEQWQAAGTYWCHTRISPLPKHLTYITRMQLRKF